MVIGHVGRLWIRKTSKARVAWHQSPEIKWDYKRGRKIKIRVEGLRKGVDHENNGE